MLLLLLFCLVVFNSAFVANVATFFLTKSELFIYPAIADLSVKFLLFMLLAT